MARRAEKAREMLEATQRLGPIWLQALSSGRNLVSFRDGRNVPEGDLLFVANVFGYELFDKDTDDRWTDYKFE